MVWGMAVAALIGVASLGDAWRQAWPLPLAHDEAALLLAGETLAQGRLTNPAHPQWEFFEAFHVLHHPTRQAKYPPGQALVLALGYRLGHPLVGVWLVLAGWGAATFWALRPLAGPGWAAGLAVLVVAQAGYHQHFFHQYFGGGLFGLAGSLVFGSVVRLVRGESPPRDGLGHGLGLALLSLVRPFEGLVFALPGLVGEAVWAWRRRDLRDLARRWLGLLGPVVVALGFQAWYNAAVTGTGWQFPYYVYNREYLAAAPDFCWMEARPSPPARHAEFRQSEAFFEEARERAREVPGRAWVDAVQSTLGRLFPHGSWLLLGLGLFYREFRHRPVTRWTLSYLVLLGGIVAVSYPHMITRMFHYVSAWSVVAAALLWQAIPVWTRREALASRPRLRAALATLVWAAALAGVFLRAPGQRPDSPSLFVRQQMGEALRGFAEGPGGRTQVVFVEYGPTNSVERDWVTNGPEIDRQPVIWARSMGDSVNRRLLEYYPTARFWLAEVDSGRRRVRIFTYPERQPVQESSW